VNFPPTQDQSQGDTCKFALQFLWRSQGGSLREGQGLTQAALAKRAGIPQPTLSLLASGSANPTLSVVIKVCNALGVQFTELLKTRAPDTLIYRKDELPHQSRRGVTIKQLLPHTTFGVAIEERILPPGTSLVRTPHQIGAREYLTIGSGCIELRVAGELFHLKRNEILPDSPFILPHYSQTNPVSIQSATEV